ncbi:MAG: 3-deoxy-D-manno-octulosonic acid transferase [Vicinamibacterales bacterium]
MYLLYSILSVVLAVVASPYFLYQAVRYKKYVGGLQQRLGYLPVSFNIDAQESLWLHAVSVGEVLTAKALLPELRRLYPRLRIYLSTTTLTGQQVARTNVQHVDGIFCFPFDLPFIVRRTLDIVRPRLFVMMETEIWPNLLRECRARGIRTALVNGRISSRSYPRYRLVRWFFRRALADIDVLCVQSEESLRRLLNLGADPSRLKMTGSLKFDSLDFSVPSPGRGPDRVVRFFRSVDERPVVIAASTLRGEEDVVLRAFRGLKSLHPRALLIVAPRHPERFDDVTRLVSDEGYTVARRTDLQIDVPPTSDVVVLDTIGELARLYQVATVVFVGGSLVDAGGHNILEPAVFGKPILFGPYMQNFREIAESFLSRDAAVQVASGRELVGALERLAGDPVRRAQLGAAARALVEENRGASGRTLDHLVKLLPPQPASSVVTPFRRVR